jgi:glyoxylase-like metal-dependent hydrolase (beta-lactamase superfamily II)
MPMPIHTLRILGLAGLLALTAAEFSGPVQAQPVSSATAAAVSAIPADGVTRFKIGSLEAAALFDGTITVANDGRTFGVGRSPADVAAVLKANGLRQDQLEIGIQPLLVRSGSRVLLFDTGAGDASFARAGNIQASLRAAGVSPAQVTDIFISHAHPDHVGGLLDLRGGLAFPDATIHLSAPEWAALRGDKNQVALAAAIAPKVVTFAPGAAVLPGLVTAVPVKGHTPGHSAYEIASGTDRLLYIGDSAHHSVISVQKPDWTVEFDEDAPTARASRRALLQRAADQNLRLYAVHFPYPGLGHVKAQGDGFVWIPETR